MQQSHLLAPAQQRLFTRLSVFVGGWTLSATEVVGAEEGLNVIDALQALVEHNLVRVLTVEGEPRFTMLETLREYALEQLAEHGEEQHIRQSHARYMLDFATRAEVALWGPRQPELLDAVERELENIRLAVAWLLSRNNAGFAANIVASLFDYWWIRCRFQDAIQLLTGVLTHQQLTDSMRAKALFVIGYVYCEMDHYTTARTYTAQSLALYRSLGNRNGMAVAGAAYALVLVWLDGGNSW